MQLAQLRLQFVDTGGVRVSTQKESTLYDQLASAYASDLAHIPTATETNGIQMEIPHRTWTSWRSSLGFLSLVPTPQRRSLTSAPIGITCGILMCDERGLRAWACLTSRLQSRHRPSRPREAKVALVFSSHLLYPNCGAPRSRTSRATKNDQRIHGHIRSTSIA